MQSREEQPKFRREDPRLIQGQGRFTADIAVEGMLHAAFVRCPHAHARIIDFDTTDASNHPGVFAVYTGKDTECAGLGSYRYPYSLPATAEREPVQTPRPFLCADTVRYAGEAVAVVLAETVQAARDAAELVCVEYEEIEPLADIAAALAPDARPIWEGSADNIAFRWSHGDGDALDEALAGSDHVSRLVSSVSRVAAMPIEPRAAFARVDEEGIHHLHLSHQSPFTMRNTLAKALGLEPAMLRIVVGDVGGSFGMKSGLLREEGVILWCARMAGRPVKWECDRSEAFLADEHGRDVRIEATLGLDADGHFTALKVVYRINAGAYLTSRSFSQIMNFGGIAGVYRTPFIRGEAEGIFTNTQPTAPYRGAGRPEATYAIERIIDIAARETGVDPLELRLRNLISADEMPYKTGFLYTYDCGDFHQGMTRAAELAKYAQIEERRAAAARRGRLRGIGIANPIEISAGPLRSVATDFGRIEVLPDGCITYHSGAMSTGQGLETSLAALVAERLGIDPERVRYAQGDTSALSSGKGSGGSSALAIGGTVAVQSAERLIEAGLEIVADHLGADRSEIKYDAGLFARSGTNARFTLAEVAAIADAERPDGGAAGFGADASFRPPQPTFPNGCHICEVEIDPETGEVELLQYVSVEDVGNVLNPALVEGQIHGGVAQGLGQAIMEGIVHDSSGQVLSGSFMDYAMPRAMDMPVIVSENLAVPTAVNPLGVKGVGEAGTVGAISAGINAICDALTPLGILHLDMPATPARVWAAIDAARRGAQSASHVQKAKEGITS